MINPPGMRAKKNPKRQPIMRHLEVLFKVRAILGYYVMRGMPKYDACRADWPKRFAEITSTEETQQTLWEAQKGPLAVYKEL